MQISISNIVKGTVIGSAFTAISRYFTRVTQAGAIYEKPLCVESGINSSPLLQQASMLILPSGYKGGTAYAELPSNGNGDLTWTRASDAWRTNADGLIQRVPWNLLQQSETFTNASWSKNATAINTAIGASGIEANVANAPNGTLTADRVNFNLQTDLDLGLQQNYPSAIASQSFVSSIYVKGEGSNIGKQIKLRIKRTTGGTFVAVDTTITLTADWVQITSSALTLLANNTGVQYIISSNDATNALIWGAQLVEGTTAQTYLPTTDRLNFPRLDYTYGSCPSALLEPQRTNLALNSEDFTNSSWAAGISTSVTANTTTAPNGTTTADTSVFNATTGYLRALLNSGITNGATYTLSFYAKSSATSGASNVRLTVNNTLTWTGAASTKVALTSSWQRITLTWTSNGLQSYFIVGSVDSTGAVDTTCYGNIDIWGAQMEVGSYPTTYIPTTSATATRVADSFSRSNIYTNGLISASGGTWFVELRNNVAYTRDNGLNNIILSNSGIDTYIRLRNDGTANSTLLIQTAVSGIISTHGTLGTPNVKFAIKWNGTTADVFVNGVKTVASTSFVATQLEILSCIPQVPLFIQQMALFNSALTDAQLATLTT